MLSKNELEIMSSFFPLLEEKSAKDIEIAVKLSHEPVFRTLKLLAEKGHLKLRKAGRTNLYSFVLAEDSYLVFTYHMTKRMQSFKNSNSLLFKRIQEFSGLSKCESVILFGSYAKGEQARLSDVDLLCVGCPQDVEKIARAFRTKYNISISPIAMKRDDFRKIRDENPAFYREMISFGIVLLGLEFFFREVYEKS